MLSPAGKKKGGSGDSMQRMHKIASSNSTSGALASTFSRPEAVVGNPTYSSHTQKAIAFMHIRMSRRNSMTSRLYKQRCMAWKDLSVSQVGGGEMIPLELYSFFFFFFVI